MSVERVVTDLEETAPEDASTNESTIRRLGREPLALMSLAYVAVIVVLAIGAPWLAPYSPNHVDVAMTNAAPFGGQYLLGGDAQGRDILSRLLWATRGTLLACVVVLAVSLTVGVTGGLLAGYFRGRVEIVANWISDGMMALPGMVLLIALYTVIGPSILTAMAVFGLLIAPANFRLVRAIVAGVRDALYVDAAKVSGLSDLRIIFRHVLTAVRAPVIIQSGFLLAAGIGIQAGLEFLGLGDPSTPSWGGILQQSFNTIYVNPGAVVAPALLVTFTTLAFVLLGNGLRDSLQRTSRTRPLSRRQIDQARTKVPAEPTDVPSTTDNLLAVHSLRLGYGDGQGGVREVVSGVDISIRRGEIHGLVGESGSGKSQTAFAILGLLPREAVVLGGSVVFDGVDLLHDSRAASSARGRRIAYVPQEPMSNLDPMMTVGQQLIVGLCAVERISRRAARDRLLDLLGQVGIPDPPHVFDLYPHQISGGMAQRVLITGAIAGNPEVLIADEPTTALDVTIQADVLELLRQLRDERQLGMLLVTHNLGVVADICDTVSVMREGEVVEHKEVRDLFANPRHSYTRELLSSTLDPEETMR